MNLARLVGGFTLALGLGSDGVLVDGGLDEGVYVVHGMVVSIVMVDAILSGVLDLTVAVIDFLGGVESGPNLGFPDPTSPTLTPFTLPYQYIF